MKMGVGHLYPEYLNIYADRGNIAVLTVRAAARGHELEVAPIGLGDPVPDGIQLFYIGGGQDREQELVARRPRGQGRGAARGGRGRSRVPRGLRRLPAARPFLPRPLGRRAARDRPAAAAHGRRRAPDDRRRAPRLRAGPGETLAGFENHAGRTILDAGAEPLGRVVAGFGNDGVIGLRGLPAGRVYGTYLHGPLLPRNPWFADRLLCEALGGGSSSQPLPDELEAEAHAVSAARRATERGGRRQRTQSEPR